MSRNPNELHQELDRMIFTAKKKLGLSKEDLIRFQEILQELLPIAAEIDVSISETLLDALQTLQNADCREHNRWKICADQYDLIRDHLTRLTMEWQRRQSNEVESNLFKGFFSWFRKS